MKMEENYEESQLYERNRKKLEISLLEGDLLHWPQL